MPDPADMSDPPSTPDRPVTRHELEAILDRKFDQKLAAYPTRVELHQSLDTWSSRTIDVAIERMTERMDQRLAEFERRIGERMDAMQARLALDVATHVNSAFELMRQQVQVLDDKYAGLLPRVTSLESKRRRR